MIEIRVEINEETGAEMFEVWDNDELIYEGYFDADTNLTDEEKYMIALANALGFEPATTLNFDIFCD